MNLDLTEALAAHAEALNRGDAAVSAERGELGALMDTAVRVKRALSPATLAPAFRAHLRDGLTMAAQHKQSQNILLEQQQPAWGWLIGAAALGSAAGLIAMVWRTRHPPRNADTSRLTPEAGISPMPLKS